MKNKSLKTPLVIMVIGLIVAVAANFMVSVRKMPAVTEQDFAYSVTYTVDGETNTFEGVYTCRFDGFGGNGVDPLDRYYSGEYTVDGQTTQSRHYTIDEKDGLVLDIITLFNDSYLMGDTKNESYESSLEAPFLEAVDKEGNQYGEEELPSVFDAEIVSWEYPEPVENRFVFAGFCGLHSTGMGVMLLVGLPVLVLCLVLVKKDDTVEYAALDKIGVVANFIVGVVVLPVISLAVCLIQAYPTGPDWIYQVDLSIPPITLFSLAASVSLRRKGYRKSGFFIQFLGVVMLAVLCVLEYVL